MPWKVTVPACTVGLVCKHISILSFFLTAFTAHIFFYNVIQLEYSSLYKLICSLV